MNIILDDIEGREKLYPFNLTRSIADLRIGILTIREKWEMITGKKVVTTSEDFKSDLGDQQIFSANAIPTVQWISEALYDKPLEHISHDIIRIDHPFQLVQNNDSAIRNDYKLVTANRKSAEISTSNKVISPENIFVEDGAIVEHSILNASTGPLYIGKNAEVMEGCVIRGPLAMCEGSLLKMGTKVYGATTLGPFCIAGGEIKNSILQGYSNKAHDGYLGDSIIGEWCNLGAGTSNSNLKNTAGDVKVWNNAENKYISAGMRCGLIMGDYSRSAINTSFNTGTVTGICCNIFCDSFPPKFVPDFTWGSESYQLEKALQDIDNWKRLKGKSITEKEIKILSSIYLSQKIYNA